MLEHLQPLLASHLADVDRRLEELTELRSQLDTYRDHIDARIAERANASEANEARSATA